MDDTEVSKEYSPYYIAICITKMQQDISYIKDQFANIVPDHENRLRILEQTKEDCQQVNSITTINTRLDNQENRIDNIDETLKGHLIEASTTNKFASEHRELFLIIVGVVLGAICTAIASELIGRLI